MILKDKCLGKFEIECNNSYTLRSQTGMTADKDGNEKPVYKVYGYYGTLLGALQKAALLLTQESSDVSYLKTYVDRYEAIWDEIKNTIKL